MQKNKLFQHLIISLFITTLGYFVVGLFSPVRASTVVQIQKLPGYINYTDFTLSCTTNGTTAQFYSKKDGGVYTPFGPAINISTSSPCQTQVTGFQFGSEGKFWFEVIVDGITSETSTTLDTTSTAPVSDFGKARMNGNTQYQLTWRNPTDSDYTKVYIYRGTTAGFTADDSHRIAEVGGNPGDTMTWVDGALDPNQEYFYAIRAIDHAGNSSSLVGDTGAITYVTNTPKPGTGVSRSITQLPKEQGIGSVLGTEATPTPEAATDYNSPTPKEGFLSWVLGHKKISLTVSIILLGTAYYFYKRSGKKS